MHEQGCGSRRRSRPVRLSPLGDQAAPEAHGYRVGPRPRLQLGKQVAHVGLDGLLREEEPHADLAVDEAVRDQLEHLDLTRRRLLLELLQGAGERDYLGAAATPLCHRVETAAVVDIAGQDLLALCSVHVTRRIGLATAPL
jgi:hypothetical protein